MEDTRDIVIQTRADLKNLSERVVKLTDLVESMSTSMIERRGAEKVARWIIGLGGGVAGGVVAKFASFIFNIPLPR
jgi:hypothetical protein